MNAPQVSQKEAVFKAYQAGIASGLQHGSKELATYVKAEMFHGITAGDIKYGKNHQDEKEVRRYSSTVTDNYFKKDERISGGKYVPETKRGPQVKDEMLIQLNTNLKSLKVHAPNDMERISRVESAISQRKSELAASKAGAKVQSLEETTASLEALGLL